VKKFEFFTMDIPDILPDVALKKKNKIESERHRNDGNSFYVQARIFDAIYAYNMAAAFAESDEDRALAYGNRSAAYLVAGKHAECLKSIKLARESGYPHDKIEKLNDRQRKCEEAIEHDDENNPVDEFRSYIRLSHPASDKIPWMVDCLELRPMDNGSRGVFTTRDLKAGDIICIEDLQLQIITAPRFYKYCNFCAKVSMMNLIPCLKTASFMFCNIECRDKFSTCFDFKSQLYSELEFLFRKVETAVGGPAKLDAMLAENSSVTVFDFDFSKPNDSGYWLDTYRCFLSAQSPRLGYFDWPGCERFDRRTRELIKVISGKLMHNSIKTFSTYLEGAKQGFSTLRAVLGNSCVPNVEAFFDENKTVIYVKRPVKAGEELFIAHM
jgi:hypothetical protein